MVSKKKDNTKNKKFISVRDKLEFIQKNCHETELFEDLKQLLRSKNFTNVEITHGNKEFGKDLVFFRHDPIFNKEKCYAAIVKNKNATMPYPIGPNF